MPKGWEIKDFESSWITKHGTKIYLRESAKNVKNKHGDVIYYEGTVEDITQRKIAEVQIAELNNLFLEIEIDPFNYFALSLSYCV